jgi:hypothetical protein
MGRNLYREINMSVVGMEDRLKINAWGGQRGGAYLDLFFWGKSFSVSLVQKS